MSCWWRLKNVSFLGSGGDIVQPYQIEEFDLCTSRRIAEKRESRMKLPPLPHESLNANSPRVKSILDKLAHYRSNPGKLSELEEALGENPHIPIPLPCHRRCVRHAAACRSAPGLIRRWNAPRAEEEPATTPAACAGKRGGRRT